MAEPQVQSLDQEDPLEKETTTHSSILAWKISWTEEPGRLQSIGSQRVRHNWATNTLSTVCQALCWNLTHSCTFTKCSQQLHEMGVMIPIL